MRGKVLGFLIFLVVCLWRATLRIRLVGREHWDAMADSGRPVLFALWHQRMLPPIFFRAFSGDVTMASKSRDGDVIAGFLFFWGFKVARGSSSRAGGEALRRMLLEKRDGAPAADLTTDGPRGPARRSKAGVALLAAALGTPALPVGSSSTRPKFIDSWDRYMVPLPFSRCVVLVGPPVVRADGEGDESFLRRLDAAIDAATDEADRLCGVTGAPRGRESSAKGEGDDE
ncbi:MAG TPA: DUF374 domain-containing protein [Thermoanaerobaculia bacterium]|nr:DUF374 domain-containing protein [Thermoanaerobaculia bacterium]HQR67111.1 DUF374 domain-containing protein [Thermoanaerobaculia bacterium]